MKTPLSSAIPKASKVLRDLLGWKYPFSQETWNVITLKRSGARNTLFLAASPRPLPPAGFGCFVVYLWYFMWKIGIPFLSCIFLHPVCSSAILPLKYIRVWGRRGNNLSSGTGIFIFVSYLLIWTWQYTQSVLCTVCWVGLGNEGGWNCCTRVICQLVKNVT